MTVATPTTQVAVLDAIVSRLIDAGIGLTPSTCFICDDGEEEAEAQHNVWVTVWPGGGGTDEGLTQNIGDGTLGDDSWTSIVIWSACKLDRKGHDSALLRDERRGLLVLKHNILATLCNHRLIDGNGNQLLTTSHITDVRYGDPKARRNERVRGVLEMSFYTPFLWDLT